MKRQFAGIVLFLPLLACLLGASSVAFNAGQPNPNPGNKLTILEGKGTYVVDPKENFGDINFIAVDTKSDRGGAVAGENLDRIKWSGLDRAKAGIGAMPVIAKVAIE